MKDTVPTALGPLLNRPLPITTSGLQAKWMVNYVSLKVKNTKKVQIKSRIDY